MVVTRAGIAYLTALTLLPRTSACDTTLVERNRIRANVLAELKKTGYVQANPLGVAGYVNGDNDSSTRPSQDFGYSMNYSNSEGANPKPSFYQMYSQRDVIVWIGCSPPQGAWYFGCTEYLDSFASPHDTSAHPGSSVVPPSGIVSGPFASMGDTLNQLSMRSTSEDFWDATIVMVTTADETAATAVIGAFREHAPQLLPAINIQVVPSLLSSKIKMGTGKGYSVFTTGCRMAPGKLNEWDSNVRDTVKEYLTHREPLLYLDGTKRTSATKPYQTPLLKPRKSGSHTEQDLESTFEAMLCQVKQRAFDMGFVQAAIRGETTLAPLNATGENFYLNGTRCIIDGGNCVQDSQDALYTTASVPLGASTMQVAVGVNHRLSHMATYGYVQYGNFSVHDRQSEGSAMPWAPQLPKANLFIALIVRSTQEECRELPTDLVKWCDSVSSEQVAYNERAYLNPLTQTGPDASELLPTKVLKFEKKRGLRGERPTCGLVGTLL